MKTSKLIIRLNEVGINDIDVAGGKSASLGEMITNLSDLGVRVPGGFVITVKAYHEFIKVNMLEEKIRTIISSTDLNNLDELRNCGMRIRKLIEDGVFPLNLSNEISAAYKELSELYKQFNVDVAVRSSATAEDLPDASFAGQQESFLNVSGTSSLLEAVRNCFASLFTDRAISYRERGKFDHFQIGLSVCVQKMVRSDLASSGVAFSLETESGFKDVVLINGCFGLGEILVQGAISPDEFLAFKPTLKLGYQPIIERKLGNKDKKMIYGKKAGERVKIVPTSAAEQTEFCLSNKMASELASWVVIIEDYYTQLKGTWCPMDIEWAVDGNTNELFIVQARPETIHSRKRSNTIKEYSINNKNRQEKIIIKGVAVGDKISYGRVNILQALVKDEMANIDFKPGDVLVADMTDPDWEPLMKIASAIITNKGGRTCHAAIVAREIGVPAIVGCGSATEILKNEDLITVSCAEGDIGLVYEGMLLYNEKEIDLDELPKTKTPLMLNVASPEMAFNFSNYPSHGVGLAREEFIINNFIQVHPMALIHHETLTDPILKNKISQIIRGYKNGEEFFVDKLSAGIARIAAAFYPDKVIVRFSDFKTNEYFNLLGGKYFEPKEENPMIGWRGASRYYSVEYKQAFGLECKALKRVREELGLKNVVVMIPFCRTVKELLQVYETMEEYGLKRGENGLEVYLMAELPSNVIMADQFARHIDGFSIGSNDLTQLVLGLDRDSALVADLYDERNDAVKAMIKMLIRSAKNANIKVGICGQGPSDFPDFAQFLVEEGIDTISVTPDSLFKTIMAVHKIERAIALRHDVLEHLPIS